MPTLKQALSVVFRRAGGPASTMGELELLGAVSPTRSWYRLHMINVVSEPRREYWTKYYRMSASQANYWRNNATRSGSKWMALLEKFVDEEGWVEV